MGLREKRLLHNTETEALPALKTELDKLVGTPIEWKIDWASFAANPTATDNLEHQALGRIMSALRRTCRDDIGKKAVREEIQRIDVVNSGNPDDLKISLENGALKVVANWGSDETGSFFTDTEIEHKLENLL